MITDRTALQQLLDLAGAGTLPTLVGSSPVRLRPLTADDVPELFAVFSDPAVTRYWAEPTLADEGQARTLLAEIRERARLGTSFRWAIARSEDDIVVGTCSLWQPDFAHRRAEVGFALGRAHWGRGYASAALEMLLSYAFGLLGFHRLEADVDPRNERSLLVLERAGFRREGLLRERWQVNGEAQDAVILGVLASEWRPRS